MSNLEEASTEIDAQALTEAAHWLVRLRDSVPTEDDLSQWLEWCEANPANLAAFDNIQGFWQSIPRELPRLLECQAAQARTPRSWKGTLGWGAAAATVVIASVWGGWSAWNERSAHAGSPLTVRIEAPARVNQTSMLPDGSRVDLSAGSTLALAFTRTQRRMDMTDGIAFFRVKPDKSRPFVVNAGPVMISAVGTAFNVRRIGGRVVVTVEEGTVKINKRIDQRENARLHDESGSDLDGGWTELRAKTGYQLTYVAHTGETYLTLAHPGAELSWRDGRLVYDGEPLEAVIANVNQYTAKKIKLSDPTIGQMRFTGTVLVNSIDTWLAALPRAFPIQVNSTESETLLTLANQ